MLRSLFLLLISCFLSVGCPRQAERDVAIVFGAKPQPQKSQYRFGIHPLYNPEKLLELFDPIADYLNANIPEASFKIEGSTNYKHFEQKLERRELDFALPNPYQTLLALKYGYKVFGKMGDDSSFKGIIIVRKDSNIKTIQDLKGKKISYPAPTALAATMLPQYYLFKHGLNVTKETTSIYAGSQESSIMNVYLGKSDAAASWPPPWQVFSKLNPDKAKLLEIKWETENLPNNALVVKNEVPLQILEKVTSLIMGFHNTKEGRETLKNINLSKFELADAKTYEPVRLFIERFTAEVRSPETEL